MNADGTGRQQLVGASDSSRNSAPDWSPDGRWITWERWYGGRFDVWIMRPDGSGKRNLTPTKLGTDNPLPIWRRFSPAP